MQHQPLYIIWHNGLETGTPILDEQHRGIIATLNSLHYFIQQGIGLDALKPTVSIMKQYIGFHLKTEEMILTEHHYEDVESLIEQQAQILRQFNHVAQNAILHRDPNLLLKFIRDWWLNHIKDEHKIYQKHLV